MMDDGDSSRQDFGNIDDVVLECLVSPSPVSTLPWLQECSLNKSHSLPAKRDVNANDSKEAFRIALKKANVRRKLIEADRASKNREFSKAFQALCDEISRTSAFHTIATKQRGPLLDACDDGLDIGNPPLFELSNSELVPGQSETSHGDFNMNCLDQTTKLESVIAPKALFENHTQNDAISKNGRSFGHESSSSAKIDSSAECMSAPNIRDRLVQSQNPASVIAPKVVQDLFENTGRNDLLPKNDASLVQGIDASKTGTFTESIGATKIPNCVDQATGVIAPKASKALYKDNSTNDLFLRNGASFAQPTDATKKLYSAHCNVAAIIPTCGPNGTYVCKPVMETYHDSRLDTSRLDSEVPTLSPPCDDPLTIVPTAASNRLSTRDHDASQSPNTAAGCASNEPTQSPKSPSKTSEYSSIILPSNIAMGIRAPDAQLLYSEMTDKGNACIPQNETSSYGGKLTAGTSHEFQPGRPRSDTSAIHSTQNEFVKVEIKVESASRESAIPRSRQHSSVLSTYDSFAGCIADDMSHQSTPHKSPRSNMAASENALLANQAHNTAILLQQLKIGNSRNPPDKENERPYNVVTMKNEAASSATAVDYKGPKLYKEFTFKTNKHIISNAICHNCLPGKVNENTRASVISTLEASECRHFVILFRDTQCKYRALYSYDLDANKLSKLIGNGPSAIAPYSIDYMFKYNSGRKSFTILSSKTLSLSIDAVAIKNALWQTVKRGNTVRR